MGRPIPRLLDRIEPPRLTEASITWCAIAGALGWFWFGVLALIA